MTGHRVKLSGVRRIKISSEHIKLDALLKFASVAYTGGEAKMMIQHGDVYVGEERCTVRGRKIRPGEVVKCGSGRDAQWLVVARGGDEERGEMREES